MKKGFHLLQWLAEGADLPGEPIPGRGLVEISGDNRVLIENHHGVKEYSRERIGVAMDFGMICVCGCGLELCRMTGEQLVIRGRIDSVSLTRRH